MPVLTIPYLILGERGTLTNVWQVDAHPERVRERDVIIISEPLPVALLTPAISSLPHLPQHHHYLIPGTGRYWTLLCVIWSPTAVTQRQCDTLLTRQACAKVMHPMAPVSTSDISHVSEPCRSRTLPN